MAEYVVEEPSDGYEAWHWLPVLERIVRCGDCRYYDEIIHACDHPCVTPLRGDCPENWIFSCFDNDFCAWGKPSEVDQCDKLRELATRFDEIQSGATREVRVSLDSGSVLRDAADTICELRNRCNNLVDERERLFRANVEKNGNILRLVREKAKLRELVRIAVQYCDSGTCDGCPIQGENGSCPYSDMAHELGVEVSE